MSCAGAVPAPDPVSPIALENQRAGTPGWELQNPALAHEIEGYAEAASVNPGETLRLHVSSSSPRFTVDVYRMGWYGGAGARQVIQFRGMAGAKRAIPKPRPEDGLIECGWPVSCRVPVGPDWASGVYLARLTGEGDGKQSFVPFVVRERLGSKVARRAPILIQCSINTWQAYNNWGGKSLYDFNSFGGRASRVSFDRPYAVTVESAPGAGAGEFLGCTHAPRAAGWDYPFVRWIERQGYDVAYTTNVDVHENPDLLLRRKAFLIVGHDEYWSRAMRDNVERARDRGVNLGIFASNVSYWQVRYEPSTFGGSDRILFCTKDADKDPVYNTDRDKDLTVRFRNLHPARPEVSLVGMMMSAEEVEGDFTPLPEARRHWVYQGTGVSEGDSFPHLVGVEYDRVNPAYPLQRPIQVLSHSPLTCGGVASYGDSAYYTHAGGAGVYNSGTMRWVEAIYGDQPHGIGGATIGWDEAAGEFRIALTATSHNAAPVDYAPSPQPAVGSRS